MLSNIFLSKKSTTTSKTNGGEEIVNLLDPVFNIPNANINGNSILTSSDFIARPDLLGLQIYDNQGDGAVLCKINGISNPFELNEEQVMFVPAPDSINLFVNQKYDPDEIISEETIFDEKANRNADSSKYKQKNDKRSPNEAVIGDNRFKINYSKRIVVY